MTGARGGRLLLLLSVLVLFALLSMTPPSSAQSLPVDVYLFWQRGCPHCARQIETVVRIEESQSHVRVHYLEIGHPENLELYVGTARALGMREMAVPLTVVGDTAIIGATSELITGPTPEELISRCRRYGCADPLATLAQTLGAVSDRALAIREAGIRPDERVVAVTDDQAPRRIKVPLIGEIELRTLSLPALTVVLAAVDGFNPCAMWVLVFLISLLLGMQDRARRWLLGGTFLLTTAVVYYALIAAWLNTLLIVGMIAWLRIAIGALALAGGSYYVWEYIRNPAALCHVAGESRRHKIMARLRAVAAEPRSLVAFAAMIVLAVGVNFIELLCSAGIPAVYTQVLALTPMPTWEHQAWIALYVAVFLLDDVLIFVIAMLTLEVTGASVRFAHQAQLVGGVVLLGVGALLIWRPEWLTFA